MFGLIRIVVLFLFIMNLTVKVNGQSWLKDQEWNFHYEQDTMFPTLKTLVHLGSATSKVDTLIDTKMYRILEIHSSGKYREFLREADRKVYYRYQGEDLRLFDFDTERGDTQEVDLHFIPYHDHLVDTILKNVLIRIDTIYYSRSYSMPDTFRTFGFSIISQNFIDANPGLPPGLLPFRVNSPMVERIIRKEMSSYGRIEFSLLIDFYVNMGMDSKPILTCFKDSSHQSLYMNATADTLGYSCKIFSQVDVIDSPDEPELYPNPFQHSLILVPGSFVSPEDLKIIMYSSIGRTIRIPSPEFSERKIILHTAELPAGAYFLNVEDKQGHQWFKKAIKQ